VVALNLVTDDWEGELSKVKFVQIAVPPSGTAKASYQPLYALDGRKVRYWFQVAPYREERLGAYHASPEKRDSKK